MGGQRRRRTPEQVIRKLTLPRIEVDPDRFTVRIDGEVITEQPAVELPLARLYKLF